MGPALLVSSLTSLSIGLAIICIPPHNARDALDDLESRFLEEVVQFNGSCLLKRAKGAQCR